MGGRDVSEPVVAHHGLGNEEIPVTQDPEHGVDVLASQRCGDRVLSLHDSDVSHNRSIESYRR
jgi:hypothetical protein